MKKEIIPDLISELKRFKKEVEDFIAFLRNMESNES